MQVPTITIAAAIALTATLAIPEIGRAEMPEPLPAIGKFSVDDLAGKAFSQTSLGEAKATVLLFIGTECPVSNGYAPTYRRLAERFESKGVAFVGIYPDPNLSPAAAKSHAGEYKLDFRLAIDADQELAKQAGVTVVPSAVVVSPKGNVLYRGRIDDRYSISGRRKIEATSDDLQGAIEAVLAGRSPEPATTEAFGCLLPQPIPSE